MRILFSKLAAAVALTALVALAFNVGYAAADDEELAIFQVTISNLTTGQPLTPPVLVTHTEDTDIFTVGEPASLGIQEIAENGNPGPLLAALAADEEVFDVTTGAAPLVPASNPGGTPFGSSGVFIIFADEEAEFLSIATMLICTNDGFTGLDALSLPEDEGESVTVFTMGYDAGTEINTEDFADMVPPCQGLIGIFSPDGDTGTGTTDPALAEGGVIHVHPGVDGVGVGGESDLVVGVHDWIDPVAMIEILRVDDDVEFEIQLSGAEEVPAVVTDASGEAEVELEIEDDGITLEFELEVCDIEDVTQAHIHAPAGPGVNAPAVLFLFGPSFADPFDEAAEGCERLSRGELSQADLESGFPTGLFGISLKNFLAALLTGNAYINVHTVAHPPGEIRGQLVSDD